MSKYVLKSHAFFTNRLGKLKEQIKDLKTKLSEEDYRQHPRVKMAFRIRKATLEIIPKDPNDPSYFLTGELRKYRRYKKGLQRFRIIFCFSSSPPVMIYLYLNDEDCLRKEGDRNDAYAEFTRLMRRGTFSHNPSDPAIQKWIGEYGTL